MGFITNWEVIGPFDNTDREGFGKIYSPERDNGLLGKHTGKMVPLPGNHAPLKTHSAL